MTAGSVMAAELAEQPGVLDRLVRRHVADRDRVAAALPGRPGSGALAGTVLLARGSSDNVAVYGRYLIELAARRPAGLAAPSIHTRYKADVDYSGYLAVALSQSGATPEIVETAARMRRSGAVVVGITNEAGSPLTQVSNLTLLTDAGPELAVPATKTVTAQMLAVAAIAAACDPSLVTVGHVPADEAVQDLGLLGELGCHHGSGGHWRSSCSGAIVGDRKHQYGITMLGAAVRGVWGWAGRGVRQATRRRPWRGGMPGEQALRGLAGPYR